MDAILFFLDESGRISQSRKVWGLVTKGGTEKSSLPKESKARMSLHFQNLMFNARTDTLFSKPSFSRLASEGRSCVVALDGYFEWKSSPLAGDKGKKQPYFVRRKISEETKGQQPYLLMAGLWNRVSTGLSEEPTLETFTILTTEPCKQIKWLHDRMPACIWDLDLALQWINKPTAKVLKVLDEAARLKEDGFDWYAVTPEMSSLKFRDEAAIQPLKVKTKSVAAYFPKLGSNAKSYLATTAENNKEKEESQQAMNKRLASPSESLNSSKSPAKKKQKQTEKGLITGFFQKKA